MDRVSILDSSVEMSDIYENMFSLGAGEILLGRLESIDESGIPIVSMPHIPQFQQSIALATIPVLPQHLGRQVALMFTQGADPQPIIMGLIYSPLQQVLDCVIAESRETDRSNDSDELVFAEPSHVAEKVITKSQEDKVYIDGQQIVLEGQEEVVLRCGEASITLSRNGKISIRGKYLLSRATGVNRILGGSVQVN